MDKRYIRNIGAVSEEEQESLHNKCALVVGLGGLGGYVVEFLARMGVGEIRLCDKDSFEESNLNRQINARISTLGRRKAQVAAERVGDVNPDVRTVVFDEAFTAKNAAKMLAGADVVIDALDNIPSRLLLEKTASEANVPLVFGSVSHWCGQTTTIYPGAFKLKKLFKGVDQTPPPVLPFSVAAVAVFQSAEAVKVLLGKPELKDKMLLIHLDTHEMLTVDF